MVVCKQTTANRYINIMLCCSRAGGGEQARARHQRSRQRWATIDHARNYGHYGITRGYRHATSRPARRRARATRTGAARAEHQDGTDTLWMCVRLRVAARRHTYEKQAEDGQWRGQTSASRGDECSGAESAMGTVAVAGRSFRSRR